MNVNKHVSGDMNAQGDGDRSPSVGFAPDTLPVVQKPELAAMSQKGVSTSYAHRASSSPLKNKEVIVSPHWYALRVTYGREKKAYDYLVSKNVEAFYPTITSVRVIDGKRKNVIESRIPNVFFVYGTEEEIKKYVYDNVSLPYLRFYYRHIHRGTRIIKEPLIVPTNQIESLKIICISEASDIVVVPSNSDVQKFKTGHTVRIIEGAFKGVVGKVARYQGQQRVAVIIDGLLTVATAYVPSAFIQSIE